MKLRKFICLILALSVGAALLTGSANTSVAGFGNIYAETEKEIFQGVYYREISGFNASGDERAYMIEVKGDESAVTPFVYNGDVRGKSTLGNMIAVMRQYGYKTVAAVNGDVYDTGSGTPKGMSVHEGNIITSGYASDRVICYDWNGRASLADVNLKYSLRGWRLPFPDEAEPLQESYYFEADINAFNVQHGAGLGMHAFNRNYAPSTMTGEHCVEVIIECDDAQLKVNGTIYGRVLSVSTDTKDSPIGENQIVLSAASGAASVSLLSAMIVGSEVEISVADLANSPISNAKEAIGVFSTIIENGRVVATDRAVHPRTAIGITADGGAIYYVVDGRQSGYSAGLDLVAVAEHMAALGCVQAVNMDGGGSSTLFARLPGLEADASLKNKPSDGAQRKVSNGILLLYTGAADATSVNVHLYPESNLLIPGAATKINVGYTDAYYEKLASAPQASLGVTAGDGFVSGDVFYAGASPGIVEINAYAAGGTGSCTIEVVDDIEIRASVSSLSSVTNESKQINITATYGSKRVAAGNELFAWSCDADIGSIDASGNFKASARNLQTGNIYVAYKDKSISIPVEIKDPPPVFVDIQEHWAKEYIEALAAQGIVKGMDETTFDPDGRLTRAQFLSLLWRLEGETPPQYGDTRVFVDVDASMWFFDCVYWGFEHGIVTGVEPDLFAPDMPISREQLASMLYRYAFFKNAVLAEASEYAPFVDDADIGDWARGAVYAMYANGIINGYPENVFEPVGVATRAQAAKVIHGFESLLENAPPPDGDPQPAPTEEAQPAPTEAPQPEQTEEPQPAQEYPQPEPEEYPH
ncbi:MAG: phosphodiester glycosidase family protein [Clostridiales Family XIII bacterium]|nr:phosphodiester glycosidase family protein [Clostridiales Family XIII bacterium]